MNIRDSFAPEVGGLGAKTEKPKQAPKPVEVAPGVFRGPDGKFYTDIPTKPKLSATWPAIGVADAVDIDLDVC